jgi:hypothetical protein
MNRRAVMSAVIVAVGVWLAAYGVWAQLPSGHDPKGAMPHGDMHRQHHPSGAPMLPGQDAFGAIGEVVRLLEADPATDWSRVDLERLRQHLIDMHEVVLRSAVKPAPVPGGLALEITGTGRTEEAVRAMVVPHAVELDRMPQWTARTESIAGGVRLTVTARDPADGKTVGRIRGLGFPGLLVQGGHHGPHHLAMAKGELPAAHRH